MNSLSSATIASAYLFSGTRGVGKTTTARILAKALNCEENEELINEPVNEPGMESKNAFLCRNNVRQNSPQVKTPV